MVIMLRSSEPFTGSSGAIAALFPGQAGGLAILLHFRHERGIGGPARSHVTRHELVAFAARFLYLARQSAACAATELRAAGSR